MLIAVQKVCNGLHIVFHGSIVDTLPKSKPTEIQKKKSISVQ